MPDTITTAVPQQAPPQDAILHPAQVYFLSRRLPGIVHLVQYDQSLPYLAVELYESDEPYTVPEGAAVNIRMAKPVPSTKKVYNPAYGISSDRHTVYIQVTPQMTVVAGCTNPVIEVVVDGGIACTGTLRLEIDPNPVQETDLIDTDEYLTIQEILAEAQAAAQIVADNEQALQDVHNNLQAIQNAAANAQAAAASAQDAKDAADRAAIESQKALGFRSYFGGQVVPDTDGDLDPSRPMSTPTAASVTIKARGDRIAGLTMAGKTTQEGTGDPSPDNIRPISGVGMYDKMLVLDGSSDERWAAFQSRSDVFFCDLSPEYGLSEGNANGIKVNRLKYNKSLPAISEDEFCFQSSSISTSALRFIIKVTGAGTNVQTVCNALGKAPLIVWYRSVNYAKSTGPFYTVVELSQDPYRAVGFELNQPLFDGDSLKVGGKSGCDQMVVFDGSEEWVYSDNTFRCLLSGRAAEDDIEYMSRKYLSSTSFPSGSYRFNVLRRTLYIFDGKITDVASFKQQLSDWSKAGDPLILFYRSTEYTEKADIPVAIEKHTGNYLIFDGTETVTATTSGSNTPYLQIAGVADNHNASHRLVSSVAPFSYSYGGAGAFSDYGNIVFGKAWCQSNGFANTETMVEDFKSFLTAQYAAGTPVQVVYELTTPVTYAQPVPTMIAQPGEDGTFTVTGENSLSVLLKAFQDGGDAATIEGHTWADILAAIQAAIAPTAQALLEGKTDV